MTMRAEAPHRPWEDRWATGYEPRPLHWLPWVKYRSFDGHDEIYLEEGWVTAAIVVLCLAVVLGAFVAERVIGDSYYQQGVRSQAVGRDRGE